MLKHTEYKSTSWKRAYRHNPSKKIRSIMGTKDCYLNSVFMESPDYKMFLDELKTARLKVYAFDISKVGVGSTKICPWCHTKKVKVDDWAEHCKEEHPVLSTPDLLRRAFAGFKVQAALYNILKGRVRSNWRQLAILEGGCYQCTSTDILFDGSPNTFPKRCVRIDTPKSRVRGFGFIKLNAKQMKERLGLDKKEILLGGILFWK